MKKDNLKRLAAYLRESEDWLTADELALQLHTTTRTVRSYVQQLNSAENQVVESSSRGYRWAAKNESPLPLFQHIRPQTPMERGLYALRKFLWQERIAVEDLRTAMIVSDWTLDADLNNIRQAIKPFHMYLHRRKEILYLSGKEIDRRRLIAYCIRQSSQLHQPPLRYITEGFEYLDVHKIHTLLLEALTRNGLVLDGYRCYELLLYVVIQVEQLQRGNVIQKEEFLIEELKLSPDYQTAQELALDLEAHFSITFPIREVEYLAALILANVTYYGPYSASMPSSYKPIYETAIQCLELAKHGLKLDFFESDFPLQITHYLLRMITRQQMRMGTPHILTQLLRNEHPLLVEIAAQMLLLLNERYHLPHPEQEIGSLVLTMADYMYSRYNFETKLPAILICPEFGNLANQLRKDLINHLGDTLAIERMITTTDIDDLSDHQLILSVLPLKGFSHAVTISPMPKSEDYRIVREEIQKIKEKQRRRQLSDYLNSYLRPETFLLDAPFSAKEELLHYMCEQLVTDDAVDIGYEQQILARERIDQTSFFDMLAVPHFLSEKVQRNSLYIALNHAPMSWDETQVNLIVLIAMQPELQDDLYTLYDLLILIFSKPKNIRAILQAKSYHEFLQIMQTLDME